MKNSLITIFVFVGIVYAQPSLEFGQNYQVIPENNIDQNELIGLEKAKAKLASNLASIMSLKIEIATNEKVIEREINKLARAVAMTNLPFTESKKSIRKNISIKTEGKTNTRKAARKEPIRIENPLNKCLRK